MASRIEQIIGEIEEYIDGCRFQPLSTTKIVVNKEELEELLRELRLKTPDEIKRYQKIISNKDAILADAQEKAEKISDLKGGASNIARSFGVQAIPFTAVLDQEGKILAKGLRGEELKQFVRENLQ